MVMNGGWFVIAIPTLNYLDLKLPRMASFLMCLTTSCLTDPKEVGHHKQNWRHDHQKRGVPTYIL